jgi:DNA modification methylase
MSRAIPGLTIGHVVDALAALPERSVQCVVTSPPYFNLRDYGLAPVDWPEVAYQPMPGLPPVVVPPLRACLGLEATPEAYIGHLVLVFRGLWRVLADDGVAWLNLGDSAVGGGGYWPDAPSNQNSSLQSRHGGNIRGMHKSLPGLPSLNLIGIPWRAAFALQADGWLLRSEVIWHKPNPMPESVRNRPTKAHEQLFLLAKRKGYWYDAMAAQERSVTPLQRQQLNRRHGTRGKQGWAAASGLNGGPQRDKSGGLNHPSTSRNRRSVWTIATAAFGGDHFAPFPPELARVCIRAGSSAAGVCPSCGRQWRRETELAPGDWAARKAAGATGGSKTVGHNSTHGAGTNHTLGGRAALTERWVPGCACDQQPLPATILDPFFGTGTVAVVAEEEGRRWLGIDADPAAVDFAYRRAYDAQRRAR